MSEPELVTALCQTDPPAKRLRVSGKEYEAGAPYHFTIPATDVVAWLAGVEAAEVLEAYTPDEIEAFAAAVVAESQQ